MKAKPKKLLLWLLFIIAIKIFPDLSLSFKPETVIFPVAVFVSLALIFLIPKKAVGITIAAIITITLSVIELKYCLYALPVICIYCAHSLLYESYDESTKISKPCAASLAFCIAGTVALIPQMLWALEERGFTEHIDGFSDLCYIICYLIFFTLLFIASCKKETKQSKGKKAATSLKGRFRLIYICAIICILASVYTLYLVTTTKHFTLATEFNYWFILIAMLIMNGDPYLNKFEDWCKGLPQAKKAKNKVK